MIAVSGGALAEQPSARGEADCSFIPVQEPEDEVPNCAYQDSRGRLLIRREALEGVDFGLEGVAQVIVGRALLYVTPAGRTAPALPVDNGADYFVEGLARTRKQGKIGFVNSSLDEVVAPTWDFAYPFENGLAVVCQGCAPQRVEGSEHSEVVGGKWGYIDKRGRVVVAVTHERDDLPPRSDVVTK
jgi:hypothetical protein